MREIKFRAWSEKVGMRNLDVLALSECAWSCPDYGKNGASIPAQPSIKVMQFTGLKDKNGKEIYEGDIVRILYTNWPSNSDDSISLEDYKKSISKIGKVVWYSLEWCLEIWSKKYNEFLTDSLHCGPHGEIEVIGNIYQNPELLKD